MRDVVDQNRKLQQRVEEQQRQIDELRTRLDALQHPATPSPVRESAPVRPEPAVEARAESPLITSARAIRLSGEAGLAFFSSGRLGIAPYSEFRVDDAKIFLEAPVWNNVYFFTGMELVTRESDDSFKVGELYADIEGVLSAGRDQSLSLRVGRFNIPFGEEYQGRNVMDNPLITHSVADIWGIDSGVQLYGSVGRFQYNLAVQNGGISTLHDYNKDKAVTARLSFAPVESLHFSISGYRTGKLDAVADGVSAIWFGGELLGATSPAQTFQAKLLELDGSCHWKEGHVTAAAGTAWYDDDYPGADYSRRIHYYSFEAMQQLTGRLYGAARYSEARVSAGGYPVVGLGDYGKYFYASPPTARLHRLSLALGYRFGPPLVWKLEYSWENGRLINGAPRDEENLFSTELALKF